MAIRVNHNEIPSTVFEAKRWWRTEVKNHLGELTDDYMVDASGRMMESLIRMKEYRNAKTVMLYVSVGKEVITNTLMSTASRQGKTVCLPLCTDTVNHIQEARLWNKEHRLVTGAYNIPTPDPDSPIVKPGEIDMVVLPCVSCDVNCNRLGHGAGYYDRYIEQLRDDCITVVFCYDKLLADKLPTEPHDRKVDMVITEENIYRSK